MISHMSDKKAQMSAVRSNSEVVSLGSIEIPSWYHIVLCCTALFCFLTYCIVVFSCLTLLQQWFLLCELKFQSQPLVPLKPLQSFLFCIFWKWSFCESVFFSGVSLSYLLCSNRCSFFTEGSKKIYLDRDTSCPNFYTYIKSEHMGMSIYMRSKSCSMLLFCYQ